MIDESLDWLAMRYVLDELSEADRASFELRMEHDLAACEAVAQFARLQSGLEQTFSALDNPLIVHRPTTRDRRSSFAVVGACMMAVCLVLIGLYGMRPAVDPELAAQRQIAEPVLDPAERAELELLTIWRSGMTETDSETDDSEDAKTIALAEPVPSWLVAGVTLELNEGGQRLPPKTR